LLVRSPKKMDRVGRIGRVGPGAVDFCVCGGAVQQWSNLVLQKKVVKFGGAALREAGGGQNGLGCGRICAAVALVWRWNRRRAKPVVRPNRPACGPKGCIYPAERSERVHLPSGTVRKGAFTHQQNGPKGSSAASAPKRRVQPPRRPAIPQRDRLLSAALLTALAGVDLTAGISKLVCFDVDLTADIWPLVFIWPLGVFVWPQESTAELRADFKRKVAAPAAFVWPFRLTSVFDLFFFGHAKTQACVRTRQTTLQDNIFMYDTI
jgi:hypothetical protein